MARKVVPLQKMSSSKIRESLLDFELLDIPSNGYQSLLRYINNPPLRRGVQRYRLLFFLKKDNDL